MKRLHMSCRKEICMWPNVQVVAQGACASWQFPFLSSIIYDKSNETITHETVRHLVSWGSGAAIVCILTAFKESLMIYDKIMKKHTQRMPGGQKAGPKSRQLEATDP